MKEAKSVLFNGNGGTNQYALVRGVDGDKLHLIVFLNAGGVAYENNVPEKQDSTSADRTWHN